MRSSAAQARRFVADTLGGWGCARDLTDLATLLVSELVTNAVLHARSDLAVVVEIRAHAVRIEVHDESPAPPVVRHHDVDAMTGRGLALVADLATDWGVRRSGAGKAVWFELR